MVLTALGSRRRSSMRSGPDVWRLSLAWKRRYLNSCLWSTITSSWCGCFFFFFFCCTSCTFSSSSRDVSQLEITSSTRRLGLRTSCRSSLASKRPKAWVKTKPKRLKIICSASATVVKGSTLMVTEPALLSVVSSGSLIASSISFSSRTAFTSTSGGISCLSPLCSITSNKTRARLARSWISGDVVEPCIAFLRYSLTLMCFDGGKAWRQMIIKFQPSMQCLISGCP
mmetsp:Transcript_29733/g.41339  ORF Transcript_29733/g.41339 Transcript_29733/m.41339 type:complete len:227 (-) Transcript_29733:1129-1809(-)